MYQPTTFTGFSLANHGRFVKFAILFWYVVPYNEYGILGITHDFMFGVLI